MSKKLKYGNAYTPSRYARGKGVTPGRITQLKDKLIKEHVAGKWFPIHCEENDKLFRND